MYEYVYYADKELDFPLSSNILVTNSNKEIEDEDFIVSNSKDIHAQHIAFEIDYYINHSKDKIAQKIKNIEKLYDISASRFDLSKEMLYSQDVANKVLLVCSDEEKREFLKKSLPDEFDLFHVPANIIKKITGHIGNLSVTVDDDGKNVEIQVDQIVWFDALQIALNQSGTQDPKESSIDDVLANLRENINFYEYKKYTIYDKTICQYDGRREEICSKCEDVCPTVAITKDDATKTLSFSQIDCKGCGGCISVCPSGALEYAPSGRDSIFEMAKFFKGHIPLILPQIMEIDTLDVDLKENVLPFVIDGEKFLHEGTLLTLLQESGSQVVFYTSILSKGTKDSISILNQIYQKRYGLDAVLLASTKDELKKALEEVQFVEGSRFTFNEDEGRKRELFAIRLSHIVGNEDLGEVTTGEHVHYGQVKVNADNCTLCLVCVGSCNVDALQADASDNTLRINPSLCTSCGYCEVSCPESDCLTIERDVIKLQPAWFKESILAQDELFACVECGVDFATVKSVEKIAAIMGPKFAHDPVKERSLYCCTDCKPKIMMQSFYDKNKGASHAKQ